MPAFVIKPEASCVFNGPELTQPIKPVSLKRESECRSFSQGDSSAPFQVTRVYLHPAVGHYGSTHTHAETGTVMVMYLD